MKKWVWGLWMPPRGGKIDPSGDDAAETDEGGGGADRDLGL